MLQILRKPLAGATQFHNNYSSWFKIIHSADSLAPTNTAGVAFLLNRNFIDVEHTQIFELVPGRALMINVPWHKGRTLTILNIYAPNTPQERDELWTELWCLPFPTIVLGDWNFVEDARDRLSGGREVVPQSFYRLKELLQLEDGWRNTFSDDREYTCIQRRTNPETGFEHVSRSRIDRVYVHHNSYDLCRGWRIDQTAVKTDHSLIATQIVCRENVKPGRGCFSLPLYLLKTRKFTWEIHRMAKNLKAEAEVLSHTPRGNDHNIQTLWAQFKRDTIEHAKKCSLLVETEDIRKLRTWKAQLLLVIHDMDMPVVDRNLTAYMLEKKNNDILRERAQEKQDLSQTQYDVEGETLHSRFWMRSAKCYHLKETIHQFDGRTMAVFNTTTSPTPIQSFLQRQLYLRNAKHI
ncbi:hypothetical protein DFH09DRAFT_1094618 [Mycena vulgaris]|nr:hypothetical protein DFH09DRAFT_1094618 [Mycena vulgaris]